MVALRLSFSSHYPLLPMRSILLASLSVGLVIGSASAQRLAVFDPFGSLISELQPPTALLAVANPPLATYPTVPPIGPPAPFVVIPGDSTFDNLLGLHWYTDGAVLSGMPTPAWPPLGPVPPVIVIPPGLLGMLGGPVTGIAIDPIGVAAPGPIMYLTSAPGMIVGVTPVPGLPVVVPPFPIPFGLAAPVTGLEWDGTTGTLWAVDITSLAYNFTPIGAPIGFPIPPASPPTGPAGDIAIDKIGTLNPVGLRPLYVVGGPLVFDMRDPAAVPFPAGPPGEGLAFMNHPAEIPVLPGCEGCPGVTTGPTAFTTSVMSGGNGGFAIGMGGLTPGLSFGVFAFKSAPAALPFPAINGVGTCPLGLTVSPTLLMVIGGPANAAGDILLPLSLAGVPVGVALHNQNFTFCPALPSRFAFSRFQTLTSGGY